MDFGVIYQLKTKNFLWVNAILYFSIALLVGAVACFFIFNAKISSLQNRLEDVKKMIALVGTPAQKELERKVFEYQKKIDDFAIIFENHKIPSNVFSLFEKLTLPNVWFYNISINNDTASIQLSGETETKEVLTQQIAIFEASEFITNVTNLSSGIVESGRLKFNLSLNLSPSIYKPSALGAENAD